MNGKVLHGDFRLYNFGSLIKQNHFGVVFPSQILHPITSTKHSSKKSFRFCLRNDSTVKVKDNRDSYLLFKFSIPFETDKDTNDFSAVGTIHQCVYEKMLDAKRDYIESRSKHKR